MTTHLVASMGRFRHAAFCSEVFSEIADDVFCTEIEGDGVSPATFAMVLGLSDASLRASAPMLLPKSAASHVIPDLIVLSLTESDANLAHHTDINGLHSVKCYATQRRSMTGHLQTCAPHRGVASMRQNEATASSCFLPVYIFVILTSVHR